MIIEQNPDNNIHADLSELIKWAKDTLLGGNSTCGTPMLVSIDTIGEHHNENCYINRLYSLHCRYIDSYPCDSISTNYTNNHCTFPNVNNSLEHWSHQVKEYAKDYKSTIEQIANGDITNEILIHFFDICHKLQVTMDIKANEKNIVHKSLRLTQNGKCIINECTTNAKMHTHRCLPGFLGGEYTVDNCVLVCSKHHYLLEQFRNKQDVLNYAKQYTQFKTKH